MGMVLWIYGYRIRDIEKEINLSVLGNSVPVVIITQIIGG